MAKRRVMVVDDSTFMRNRIKKALIAEGAEIVGEAKDGNDAVKLYQELKPDLVTMDITMRGKDGLSATKEIMAVDPNANIIMVTILQSEEYKKIAENLGVKGFITKNDFSQLKAILENI